MSDDVEQVAGPEPSAGTMLREAREAAGLHIAALAVSLKVPVRKLEALEADNFDVLPDAVFVRALASSVCRTLKIDPAPVLKRLPQTARPRLIQDDSGINAPFRAPSDVARPSWLEQMSKPVYLAVFALLIGALVLIFMPPIHRDESAAASQGSEPAAPPPVMVLPAPESSPVATPDAATALTSAPAASSVAVAAGSVSSSLALSTPTVASPTLVITPATAPLRPASAPAPSAAAVVATASAPQLPKPQIAASGPAAVTSTAATGVVTFSARGESWIEVTDAKGVAVLRKLLTAGEKAGASGALPMTVIVGRADATDVQVRGKPFNLGPLSRDNVARFEVK